MKYPKDFFEKILEFSHDEISVCDKNGITLYCNKSFENNYGLTRDEVLGKSVMYIQEKGCLFQTPVTEVIRTKKAVSLEQQSKTGIKLIITATPLFDKNGDIEYIIENCRDITELNNIKDKLESSKKTIEMYKNEVEMYHRSAIYIFDDIVFKSESMKSIFKTVDQISNSNVNILILGESGTGKTSLARYIHSKSDRKDGPFITINCTTISPSLLESELFGYTKGAFTGANSKGKIGLVELADGGTLFLDEIGDIPPSLQAKFLQLAQDKTFIQVGGVKEKKVDIRIISATNVDLFGLVKEKRFREDLYYRLNVVNIKIPALRERIEDLPLLIENLLKRYNHKLNMNKTMSKSLVDKLSLYRFPGNIRELENLIQNLLITSNSENIYSLPLSLAYIGSDFDSDISESFSNKSLDELLSEYEGEIIRKVHSKTKSSYKLASYLNISQPKAYRLIKKYVK